MTQILTFSQWMMLQSEAVAPNTLASDPNRTAYYQNQNQTKMMGGSDTQVNEPSERGVVNSGLMEDVNSLKEIHTRLQQIYGRVKNQRAFRFPQIGTSFEQQLIAAIDSIGRCTALLEPTARGISKNE